MPKKYRNKKPKSLPFVSICTPTFNRRPFISQTIKCYLSQDYPSDKIEWIIIDDGTDKIEELVIDIPGVKYFKYEDKMTLGKKRNLMHEKSKGDIIVYMDDDDYYPPCRVSHAVEKLQKSKTALCAGSSEIYIYFKHIQEMWQMGPYGPTHSTAGTFAFKRELLKQTSYDETACLAEEKHFLKNYTIPFVQLDPLKTILVFSHCQNTFDKKILLKNGENKFQKKSIKTVNMFIKDSDVKDFYVNKIEELLKDYKPGDPSMKPDVIKQYNEIQKKRESMGKQAISVTDNSGNKKELNMSEIANLLQEQQRQISYFKNNTNTVSIILENGNKKELTLIETANLLKQNISNYNDLKTKYDELERKYNELETKYNETQEN
jgi:glycosyltransferase involved in cell wall biosynthesis